LGVENSVTWSNLTKYQVLPSNLETSIMAEKANTASSAKGKAAGLTKAEAIRQAIAHLGKDAKPLELQAHIKAKFGIDITTDHISAAKTEAIRKVFGAAKPATVKAAARTTTPPRTATRKPAAKKPTPTAPPARPPAAAASNGRVGSGIALADIAAVKALVGRVGAANLKSLIDVLAQ
jgi:hypothetical protein